MSINLSGFPQVVYIDSSGQGIASVAGNAFQTVQGQPPVMWGPYPQSNSFSQTYWIQPPPMQMTQTVYQFYPTPPAYLNTPLIASVAIPAIEQQNVPSEPLSTERVQADLSPIERLSSRQRPGMLRPFTEPFKKNQAPRTIAEQSRLTRQKRIARKIAKKSECDEERVFAIREEIRRQCFSLVVSGELDEASPEEIIKWAATNDPLFYKHIVDPNQLFGLIKENRSYFRTQDIYGWRRTSSLSKKPKITHAEECRLWRERKKAAKSLTSAQPPQSSPPNLEPVSSPTTSLPLYNSEPVSSPFPLIKVSAPVPTDPISTDPVSTDPVTAPPSPLLTPFVPEDQDREIEKFLNAVLDPNY